MWWEQLKELDKKLFLLLNHLHVAWLDLPMFYMSSDWFWLPLYVFFIYLIIRKFKRQSWLVILFLIVAVTASDQGANRIKKATHRLRPSHAPLLEGRVHLVNNYRGGQFGFISSHAANTFCVATFLSLLFPGNALYVLLLFLWAFLVTYTRLYLGVHYPADLFCGALLGSGMGLLFYIFLKRTEKALFHNRSLP